MSNSKTLSSMQKAELIQILKARFAENMVKHEGIEWQAIETKLEAYAGKLWPLNEMETTGGEPDVVG